MLARAVDDRGLIERAVDAVDRGHVDDHVVADVFPDAQERQDERPEAYRFLLIPLDRIHAHADEHVVDQALVGRQEGIDKVAHDNPGEEVRQEDRRLADLRQAL